MIVSHKYKFIFIKTMKTAGTSIEVFFGNHCGEDDIITKTEPPTPGHKPRNYKRWNKTLFWTHMWGADIRHRVGKDAWRDYYKFCVERNPFDKTLSYYYFIKGYERSNLTFDRLVMKGPWVNNFNMYTELKSDKLLVDRVVRYENLNQELGEVFEMLGVPWEGKLGVRAKGEYRTDRRPYQEVYTAKQRKMIEEVFRKEIVFFNYEF